MRAPFLVLIALLIAVPGSAQQWTQEEQSVIDHVKSCWDAWVDALADETPDRFFQACPEDENAHYWWTSDAAPQNRESVERSWSQIREVDDDWADLRPIHVNVFGDVAIIQFYGYWKANTPDGLVRTQHKRTEVFQQRGGGWVFLGAQGTPSSAADAEPYKSTGG